MHNLITTSPISDSQLAINASIIDEALSYDCYSYWIPASDFSVIGTNAVYVAATATIPAHWLFSDAASDDVGAYVRRHREWRYGGVSAQVHWSAPTGAGAYTLRCSFTPAVLGATFSASTNIHISTTNGSANTLNVTNFVSPDTQSYSFTDMSDAGIYVTFGRNVADATTDDLSFFGLELLYRESAKQAGNYKATSRIA